MKNWSKGNTQWGKRAILLLIYDIISINFASFLALILRFDFTYDSVPNVYMDNFISYIPVNTVCTLLAFYTCRMYHSLWFYASVNELWNAFWGCMGATVVHIGGMLLTGRHMPRSYWPMYFVFLFGLVVLARFSYRLLRFLKNERISIHRAAGIKNVMVIGAGSAGKTIVDEIHNSRHINYNVRCIIDDSKGKRGRFIGGVPVVGDRYSIVKKAEELSIDIILFAIPSIGAEDKKEILELCQQTSCELRMLPGVYQLVNSEVAVSMMRKVDILDLLGREEVKVDVDDIVGYVKDKVVLVTGGGGSIGSELCRQIAGHNPKQLIIFDIYENNAYEIQQELLRTHSELNLVVLIGSVRNTHRVQEVFEQYRPDIVYHAAAHKHVPLMEKSPNEAIKNNVFGTWKTARAAMAYGTEKFVLISTDKAVNPTNIMGASKRLCEMIVQMFDKESETEFVAVRFGNVLGSNGSVIPLFRKQIENGGPVTVTHKDIIRYFMTIPEAVALVLQAGAYAKGGEIFVLDMGEPVRIDDLARKMIRLSGYTPDEDMMIEYTGLRPGEKLYEEMLMDEEGLKSTANKLIHIGKPIEMDVETFKEQLQALKTACEMDDKAIKHAVRDMVATYKIDESGDEIDARREDGERDSEEAS